MRNTYYQSAGNPLQPDRLPTTRPATELAPNAPAQENPASMSELLGIATFVGAVLLLAYRPPGFSWLDPYDLVLAIPLLLCGLAQSKTALHPLAFVAIGIVCLNYRIPWAVQVAVTGIASGLLVYQFGQHNVAILTTPPMPRKEAEAVRVAASDTLGGLATITAILVVAALAISVPLVTIAAVTLPIAFLFTPAPADTKASRGRLCFSALSSWFSYSPQNRPGILQSPAGPLTHRAALTIFTVGLMAIGLIRSDASPLSHIASAGAEHHAAVSSVLDATDAGRLERLKHGGATWLLTFAVMAALPVIIPIFLTIAMSAPAIAEAASAAAKSAGSNETQSVVNDLRTSPDPIERESLFLGRVVADGSPLLVPRTVFHEHAHGLGDSGSGKTSLFLCPIIEQLVMSGDASVIVLDLKADTLELLATLAASAEKVRQERGLQMPLKVFSNQPDKATFAFNPMTQPFWSKFDFQTRTDILCGANGLTYGTDYGQGYYSSANAAVLYHAVKSFPHVDTFHELADCIGNVLTAPKKKDLHPEIRKAGVHVQEVIKRLAACQALNVTRGKGHDDQVVDQAIDLTQPFLEPQLLYFHLSATLSPAGAPEMARLVNYMLLAASTQTERKHQVFLVIDEFQRMVAGNLEYMLQLARSMGVGVILANQSMEDLKKSTVSLIPAIEANCRLRQWFSVSSKEDRERLIRSSGETVDIVHGRTRSEDSQGNTRYAYSETERVGPRITLNDVLLTSDHPFRSILKISRGQGYAQYGGMPVIIESSYHISEQEYRRRRAMPWPELPGTFVPANRPTTPITPVVAGPTWTQEIIGQDQADGPVLDSATIDEFLDGLKETFESNARRRKGPQS